MAVNEVDPAPTGDAIAPDAQGAADDGLHLRIAELIDESVGLSQPSADWSAAVALELAQQLLPRKQAELRLGEEGSVQTLNVALYRMSYEAALACEHARQLGARARRPPVWSDATASTSGDPRGPAETLRQRLRSALVARGDDPEIAVVETVEQLARVMCLGMIDAYEARDRYDYPAMQSAVDAIDDCLHSGCTLKSFPVLGCTRAIADAGLSRDPDGTPPSRRDLEALAGTVTGDRDAHGGPYVDHALLLLVSAVGQMQRSQLVDEVTRSRVGAATSRVDWILEVLKDMEERGVAKASGWPTASRPNPVAHHVYYYRHFAHHIQAIALANQLKESVAEAGGTPDAGDTSAIAVAEVRKKYLKASASLERALQLVPPSNEARWRYYDLNAESLEHEESLRIELLEQRLSTRQIVQRLAEANVKHLSEEAQHELRSRMADVSMRIVEVIGVFLAVVAILGVTVASATVDGLSLGGRILILAVGGSMPVVYFVLLRLIVTDKLSKRRSKH